MTPKKSKSGKNKNKPKVQQAHVSSSLKPPENKVKRFFTIVICVVVALGLMVPVAGLGVASCSPQQEQSTDQGTTQQ